MSLNFVFLSWQQFDTAVEKLADYIKHLQEDKQAKPSAIYGQPRGGLPLAVALSHRTDIPMTTNPQHHELTIWVDDILETGRTLIQFKRQYTNIIPLCWVNKTQTSKPLARTPIPKVKAITTIDDPTAWVIFPWESFDMDTIQADMGEYHDSRR